MANEKIFLDPRALFYLIEKGNHFDDIVERLSALGAVCTDVKGLMEIVYYYHLMGETERGYSYADRIRRQVEVFPVTAEDIDIQDGLLDDYPNIVPRELLHSAVMIRNNIKQVLCSPDSFYREMEEVRVANRLGQLGHI